jgi:hypothetical protein
LFGPQDAESPRYLGFLADGYLAPGAAHPGTGPDLVDAVRASSGAEAADELRGIIDAHRRAWGLAT